MEENENIEQEEYKIDYKIEAGKEIKVERQDHNGKAFYKVSVSKKNKDNTLYYTKKNIFFKEGVDLKDGTIIKIKKGFEDFWNKDKYTPIFSVFVTDFEVVNQPDEIVNQAYDEYNSNNSFDLPF